MAKPTNQSLSGAHRHPEHEKEALKIRLRKMAGQIKAIEKMLEEDQDCSDVLTQVISVKKALKSFAEKLIYAHMNHCIEGLNSVPDGKQKLRELLEVLERYVE